jgi:acetyl-CoA C-acetyltransferase
MMRPDDVAILAAARSPFGKFGGSLRELTIPELGGYVFAEALRRSGLSPEDVDEVAVGVNLPGADRSLARQILIKAGLPPERVAYTVDRACCSSLAAITLASRSLRLGDATIALAGGSENLSRVPYFLTQQRWGHALGDVTMKDQLVIACPMTGKPRAVQASEEADEFGVTREEQDAWALRSHMNYVASLDRGAFEDELFPIEVPDGNRGTHLFEADESVRRNSTLERLAALPTVYGSSSVTAGNAPGLSTGATSVVLTTVAEAERLGKAPLATLHGWSMASGHPDRIASIPAVALRMALKKARLGLDDLDLIEINEAFAAVPLVSTLVLAEGDRGVAAELRSKVNVNGGAIAIGHPTGATAARLVMTAMFELRRRHAENPSRPYYAGVTLCGGIGEAEAVIVRVGG